MYNRFIEVFVSGVLILVGIATYHFCFQPKTGYILIQEVYNNFDFKKEMEKKFLATKNARQKKLDSLEMMVNSLGNKIGRMPEKERNSDEIAKFHELQEEYQKRKRADEEDNSELSAEYDREILTQLNQYIKDYGTQNNYTYIFGNDGNGSLMFAIERRNISNDVIEYVNKKYSGQIVK